MYPFKKKGSFGIQKLTKNKPSTNRVLKHQHPSWNSATGRVLHEIMISINRWNTAKEKLILTNALAP